MKLFLLNKNYLAKEAVVCAIEVIHWSVRSMEFQSFVTLLQYNK